MSLKDTIAGYFAGATAISAGYPFDTIKVRFQTMTVESGKPPPYKSILDCFRQIVQKEGFLGLYRGMLAPLAILSQVWALYFFGYSVGKHLFWDENTQKNLDIKKIVLAGAFAGLSVSWIYSPIERLKCILQVQKTNPLIHGQTFKGPTDLSIYIIRNWGVRSLFRGLCATQTRDLVGGCIYFTTYEILNAKFPSEKASVAGLLRTMLFGGITGITYWSVVLPIDTLKSRIQISPEGTYPNGMRSAIKQLLDEKGISGLKTLYRGLSATMVRAVPVNAGAFFRL